MYGVLYGVFRLLLFLPENVGVTGKRHFFGWLDGFPRGRCLAISAIGPRFAVVGLAGEKN